MSKELEEKKGELEGKKKSRAKMAEQLEKILERRKEDDEKIKILRESISSIDMKYETSSGMTVWRFLKDKCPEEYKSLLEREEFDKYVTNPNVRRFLGLNVASKKAKTETKPKAQSEDRLYLTMTFKQKTAFQKLADEIFGENKKDCVKWDGSEIKRWYLYGDGIAKAEMFEEYKPHDFVPADPAPTPPSVSEIAAEPRR